MPPVSVGITIRRASQVAPPTLTPWRSLNARLDAPADLHITVFQELDTEPDTP
ncbi:hypothetical protein [Micromonospora sp. NPDC049102]|uniref:hypothetical protein n=1 Tax=Micromonospora sp. NPDC049102 TaxID=3364265 RepID=UPI0037182D65